MAAGLRACCLLLLLISSSLADNELPCEGFEVVPGFGMANIDAPPQIGVKNLQVPEIVESDEACWGRCCQTEGCDLAVRSPEGKCNIIRCTVDRFNLCQLTAQEGAQAYRRVNAGTKPKLEDFCLPKNDSGPCRASFPRWWFEAESGTCKAFTFGGCVVNLNNHASEEDCLKTCSGVAAVNAPPPPPPQRQVADRSLSDACSGGAIVGRCRASFSRWFFNSSSGSCEHFIYGGCGGSSNNHATEQACMDSCISAKKPEPELVQAPKSGNFGEYCAAPPATGNCRAAFRRFYYDANEGVCKTFVYGGCNPNKNNYLKEDDCMRMCAGRSEGDDHAADHIVHRPLTAVILPILLAILAASLLGVMIVFFVKVAKKNQRDSDFRALWNPIDDKECLMNNAYTL